MQHSIRKGHMDSTASFRKHHPAEQSVFFFPGGLPWKSRLGEDGLTEKHLKGAPGVPARAKLLKINCGSWPRPKRSCTSGSFSIDHKSSEQDCRMIIMPAMTLPIRQSKMSTPGPDSRTVRTSRWWKTLNHKCFQANVGMSAEAQCARNEPAMGPTQHHLCFHLYSWSLFLHSPCKMHSWDLVKGTQTNLRLFPVDASKSFTCCTNRFCGKRQKEPFGVGF